jgi:hypothetical protein
VVCRAPLDNPTAERRAVKAVGSPERFGKARMLLGGSSRNQAQSILVRLPTSSHSPRPLHDGRETGQGAAKVKLLDTTRLPFLCKSPPVAWPAWELISRDIAAGDLRQNNGGQLIYICVLFHLLLSFTQLANQVVACWPLAAYQIARVPSPNVSESSDLD